MGDKNNKGTVLPKYKIIDEQGKVIVNDFKRNFRLDIHKHKLKKPFLTYDNKYFINPGSSKLKVVKSNDDKIVKFDIKKFKKYNIATLMDLVYATKISSSKFNKEINKYDIIVDEGNEKNFYRPCKGRDKAKVNNIPKRIKEKFKYKVCDKNGKVLVNDKKIDEKVDIYKHILKKEFVSFDNKYFFNPYSKKLLINKSDDDKIIPFDFNRFSKYKVIELRDLEYTINLSDAAFNKEIRKYDIIFDYDIRGIDLQVKNLVYAINNCGLNIKTTGSCSGHGRSELWVSVCFKDFDSLKKILVLIDDKFNDKFYITSRKVLNHARPSSFLKNRKEFKNDKVVLCLATVMIGEEAYKMADEFAKVLLKNKKEWSENI